MMTQRLVVSQVAPSKLPFLDAKTSPRSIRPAVCVAALGGCCTSSKVDGSVHTHRAQSDLGTGEQRGRREPGSMSAGTLCCRPVCKEHGSPLSIPRALSRLRITTPIVDVQRPSRDHPHNGARPAHHYFLDVPRARSSRAISFMRVINGSNSTAASITCVKRASAPLEFFRSAARRSW